MVCGFLCLPGNGREWLVTSTEAAIFAIGKTVALLGHAVVLGHAIVTRWSSQVV